MVHAMAFKERLELEILHVCSLSQDFVVTPGVWQSVQKSRNDVITKYIRLCIPQLYGMIDT